MDSKRNLIKKENNDYFFFAFNKNVINEYSTISFIPSVASWLQCSFEKIWMSLTDLINTLESKSHLPKYVISLSEPNY